MDVSKFSSQKLISMAEELHSLIYVACCFSGQDVLLYDTCITELIKRGYHVSEDSQLIIKK